MDLDTSLGLRDFNRPRFKGTLVLVLTYAFGYQLVVTHYLKCFCLINKMVQSLGLNQSSNVVPVGPHEIEQTRFGYQGGGLRLHTFPASVCAPVFVLLLPICQQSETRPGPRTGRGHRFTVGQVPSQLLVRETINL